jgi:hypothetical protein
MADNDNTINTIDYGAIAEKLSGQVTTMRAEVPFLTDGKQINLRKLISGAAVPDPFIEHLATVVTSSPKASSAVDDIKGMQDRRRFAAAFAALETQLRELADNIHVTSVTLRHESGLLALDAYATLQGLLRQPGGQAMGVHIRTLRAMLGRGRGRGAKKPKPTPDPNTNPTT